jgi:hypothetical protein
LFSRKREACGTQPPEAASNILGFFIIKRLLNITLFRLHKRPNIFNVLAMTSAYVRRGPAGRGLKRTLKILIPYADTVKADETCQEPASVRVRRPIKIFT